MHSQNMAAVTLSQYKSKIDSTRQQLSQQMLEIIKQKDLLEQARNLSKERKQKQGKEVIKVADILTGEETIFNSLI